MTFRHALTFLENELAASGLPEAKTDAWLLFSAVTGMDKGAFYLREKEEIEESGEKELIKLAGERKKRIPVQYLIGKADFFGLTFSVSPEVLIPRPDTETLVEEILSALPEKGRLLELCTGSGCVAVSVKRKRPEAIVTATDVSGEALALAGKNAADLGAEIEFVLSDLFREIRGNYDVIAANPPYVKTAEIETLEPEVKEYEPRLALDGGERGLSFYRRIIPESREYLLPGGSLLVEIGDRQGCEVFELFMESGFSEVQILRDLAGKDRVVRGKKDV